MAKDTDHLAGRFETENTGGFLTGFLAEEHVFDRRALLRLVMWGVAAVSAVSVAMVASQSPMALRHDLATGADLARQTQQIQALARESQNETRRLAAAIDTLNGDRDRLFSRTTVLEQGLESVTGAIARQNVVATPPPAAVTPQPTVPQGAPAATVPAPMAATGAKPATSPIVQPSVAAPSAAAAPSPITANSEPAPPSPVAAPAPSPTPAPTAAAKSTTTTTRQSPAAASPQASASTESPAPNPALTPASGPTLGPPPAQTAPAFAATAAKSTEKPPMDASEPGRGALPSLTKAAAMPAPAAPDPSSPLMAAKSMLAPPDAGASKLIAPEKPPVADAAAPAPEAVGSVPTEPDPSPSATPNLPVKRTEFGVDVGGASSVGGLRAMWRGLVRSNPAVAKLSPIIVVREGSGGLGMQLRLVAGPLDDAAAAAKICAALTESQRSCEPTVFDGQRLAVKADGVPTDAKAMDAKTPATRPSTRKRSGFKRGIIDDQPKRSETSSLSALFGRR